jgi:AraC family transcriptional activator of pyochelin receptor
MNHTQYCTDSFFKIFMDEYAFEEKQIGREIRYNVSERYGSGYLNRFLLRNGIFINIMDMQLNEEIRIPLDLRLSIFEVVHCLQGSIHYYDEETGDYRLDEGHYSIYMKDRYTGWMVCPKNMPIKCISVVASDPLSGLFSYREEADFSAQQYEALCQEKAVDLMKPQSIFAAIKEPFLDIDKCRLNGISRLIYMESKAAEIISLAYVQASSKPRASSKVVLNADDRLKLVQAEHSLLSRLAEPLTLGLLAIEVGLNAHKLKEGFRQVYGKSIFSFIKDARLEKARQLLISNEDMNINEIVNEVGYSNTGHFARAFREKWGANPRDYRFRM